MTERHSDDELLRRARSYDEVAESYERVTAPLLFDEPGRALVDVAGLKPGEQVLDVGSGTGAVARAALRVSGSVVSVDPSVRMLAAAQRGGVEHAVVGALPALPFAESAFDVVLSAFVLTHVDEADAGAADILRVLRSGGRVALSAWSPADDEFSKAWLEVVSEFVVPDVLAQHAHRVLPGDARFSRSEGQAELLDRNGFTGVRSETRTFDFELSVEQMIETRGICANGRALRSLLSDEEWRLFQERVRNVLGRKFPHGIRYQRRVFFAVGRKS